MSMTEPPPLDINWSEVESRLRHALETLITRVRERFPEVAIWTGQFTPRIQRFSFLITFMFDPRNGEFEDLVLRFSCRPASQVLRIDDTPVFPDAPDRDAVDFLIEGYGGEDLALMEPELLSADTDPSAYEQAVLAYADRVEGFVADHMHMILERLTIARLINSPESPPE